MSTSNSNTSIYDQDFYLWIQETIQALQLSKLDPKEIPHLIEELEDMGNSQEVFPQECPFDPKDVLNPEYLP